ncbi:MAG TPA: carboxypeptidase regulatory-like domain-containing protein [Luteitalea sp.]|nr:carboxypeptidase regulatory-like domain-containing protein [Luteitalea sp.]
MRSVLKGAGVRLLAVLCLLTASSTAAWAQVGLSTLTGIASDTSGAAVPGVTVTATNTGTSIPYTGVTTDAGAYTITGLPVGNYSVKFELQGFKSVQTTLNMAAGQTARVDAAMEVGNLSESIEVVATGAILQTENAVVGGKFEREQVEKLPLQGRNVSATTLYTAGVTVPSPGNMNSLKGSGARPYANGQREQANNFTIDGIDTNDPTDNLIAYQPSPDAVEQVNVETNNYSPEMGNVAGASVNMVIKSGTNDIRGNAFYYWRDNELAATPWATNRAGGRKAEFTRKVFGGTAGGPIVRGKLFWFADYQGGRQENPPADSFATVIPDAWRNGDLSSLLPGIQLRDPDTGQPFVNNQIPVSRFSPFARALLANEALYPRANVNRAISDFRQNYIGKSASTEETNQFDIKVDWNASANDKVYVRYSRQQNESRTQETAMPLIFGSLGDNPFWSVGANWNRIISKNIVNDVIVGYNANQFNSVPLDLRGLGNLNNQLGIGGAQPIAGLTEVRMGNNVGNIGTIGGASEMNNGIFQLNERLTWLKGRHTLKFGASWNHYIAERYYAGNNGVLGYIAYGGTYTGAAFGDFLLDKVSSKGRGSLGDPWTHYQDRFAFYAGDDLKLTDNLTLNLALRWGNTTPFVEKDDRQSNFDLSNLNQRFAGQNGNSRALYEPYYNGWEPRLGFAYRKGEKWVFRGGYGITQYQEGTGANLRLPLNPPFFFESQRDWQYSAANPGDAGTIATGFDGLQSLTGISGQLRAWDPNMRPQLTQQYNVFAEYLLGPRSSINIGYVGNRSKYLVAPIEGNQPLPGVGDPSTWAPIQTRRPLYQFNPLVTNIAFTSPAARSNYNALQTTFKQRLWGGLDFVANYTLGKAMSNNLGYYGTGGVASEGAYPVNSYDIEANYGPAFFDARHIWSVAGSYQIPFGIDRKFGSNINRAVDAIAGGWDVSFAFTAHTGYPITVQDSNNPSLQATRSTVWPDLIGNPVPSDQTVDRWLDRSAFRSAALGTFGNAGVGVARAAGYWNTDLSLTKRIVTFGRQYLVLRGEAYNLLNHPNFGPPDRNIQSQTFGTITSVVADPRVIQLVVKYHF